MEQFHIFRLLEVEHGAQMQLARPDMGVIYAFNFIALDHLPEIIYIVGQELRADCRIFDNRYRLGVSRYIGEHS